MKILHINQSDVGGGAGIAAYRLHQGLLSSGVNSRLLVGKKITASELVSSVIRTPRIEKRLSGLAGWLGLNYVHLLGTFLVPRHIFFKDADIIHFHNLHMEYFNYLAIPRLTTGKHAVITLHDLWFFTGHCAYPYDCERWKTGCGGCPRLQEYPGVRRDNTKIEWKLKKWVCKRSNISVVAPSRWLAEEARKSILGSFPIHFIPHGIDTQAYQPIDKELCRDVLGIPAGRKVLMFGAPSLSDHRKGGDLLVNALRSLPEELKREVVLLTIGDQGDAISDIVGMTTISLGYVSSDRLKSIAYSAADLFVFPTRADIFGLVLLESMACGTPMVSFEVGGVPDLVRPDITGYLAKPQDYRDFAQGVMSLLEEDKLRMNMANQCREIALKEYSIDLMAKRYIALYEQVIFGSNASKGLDT